MPFTFDNHLTLHHFINRSHYRRTSSGPLPELNNNDPNCQSKNSQDNCYRKTSVDGATLNGHRESLLDTISDGRNALRRSREENPTSLSTLEAASGSLRSQKTENSHQVSGMTVKRICIYINGSVDHIL